MLSFSLFIGIEIIIEVGNGVLYKAFGQAEFSLVWFFGSEHLVRRILVVSNIEKAHLPERWQALEAEDKAHYSSYSNS